jgi:hypothetical protein
MRRAKPSLLAGPSGKSPCLKASVKIRGVTGADKRFFLLPLRLDIATLDYITADTACRNQLCGRKQKTNPSCKGR